MPRLYGEHIMLREYKAEDLPEIRKWVNDPATTRYLSTIFWRAQSLVDSREFLDRQMQTSHNAYNFVIASLEDESYLGQLDMFRIDWRLRQGELGLVIGQKDHRCQGIGCEALQLMQSFVFDTLGLERLEMEVHMDNAVALACYRNAGFTLEGVKRHAFFSGGQYRDVGVMSVLRGEFEARRSRNSEP